MNRFLVVFVSIQLVRWPKASLIEIFEYFETTPLSLITICSYRKVDRRTGLGKSGIINFVCFTRCSEAKLKERLLWQKYVILECFLANTVLQR